MNNDALVAALGMDAVAAVHGYRRLVLAEAERRGLRLVSEALSEIVRDCAQAHIIDPIDIRLSFRHCPGRPELAGRVLRWGPAHGWSVSHRTATRRWCISPGRAPDRCCWFPPPRGRGLGRRRDSPARPHRPPASSSTTTREAIRRLLGFIGAATCATDARGVPAGGSAAGPPARRTG